VTTLPRDQYLGALYNPSLKIRGHFPTKICVQTHAKFGRFYTTSDFDREYLWNESGKPKLERHVIETDSSRVQQEKSGELLFTNYKVGHVSLDPPKRTILEDYIPPLVVVAPQIFTHTSD